MSLKVRPAECRRPSAERRRTHLLWFDADVLDDCSDHRDMLTDDPIPALKQQLAREIRTLLGRTNQHVAARVLGVDQPRMSDLLRDRLTRFSLEKLIRLLGNIDHRVKLEVVNEGPAILRLFYPKAPRGYVSKVGPEQRRQAAPAAQTAPAARPDISYLLE